MNKITTLTGNKVSVLGLGSNPNLDSQCLSMAYQAGINYFFFYNLNSSHLIQEMKKLAHNYRPEIIIATGCESRKIEELEKYRVDFSQKLEIDTMDVFLLEYISSQDDIKNIYELLNHLHQWKKREFIRYLGITTHNRSLAVNLLSHSQIDILMHRYNMAHRQAEKQVFPTAISLQIPVISFTSTRWSSLLNGHPHWHGKIPKAVDCYRFVLQHPAINLTLTSPKTIEELRLNLAVLDNIKMSQEEYQYWQEYGDLIYGKGQDNFETQWL